MALITSMKSNTPDHPEVDLSMESQETLPVFLKLQELLASGKRVKVPNFGVFTLLPKKEKTMTNSTGTFKTKEGMRISFRAYHRAKWLKALAAPKVAHRKAKPTASVIGKRKAK